MTAVVLRGDAAHLPLPDACVDLIVTSPPYFGLRSYSDNGGHYDGQIGSEATPGEWLAALAACTAEWVRVLKPAGSIFVNLGDSYSSGQSLDNAMTVGDAGWLAGLIDADGCVTVRRAQQPTMRAPTFEGIIAVEQEDKQAVERAHAICGRGHIATITGSRGKPMYRWTVSTQQARWVAERIWPWLRIKQRQALAIVELGRHREEHSARGRWNPIRPEWITYRERICQAVRAWNQREPDDWEPPALPVIELPLRPRFLPAKTLMGLPWRYAFAVQDELGLILRRDIVWQKVNGLPESVTDRCRSSHEYLFHFTVRPRYYAAVDEIREPHAASTFERKAIGQLRTQTGDPSGSDRQHNMRGTVRDVNPLGKLPGSVWDIPSQPLTVPAHLGVDHFAAFPMELPRRVVLGWSPPGVCCACGEGRRPVRGVDWSKVPHRMVEKRALTAAEAAEWCAEFADWCEAAGVSRADLDAAAGTSDMGGWWASRLPHRSAVPTPDQWAKLRSAFDPPVSFDSIVHLMRIVPVAERDMIDVDHAGRNRATGGGLGVAVMSVTGYACACPQPDAPTRPAVVVDPFGGTGTTALVAAAYGRTGISVDLSGDYCRLAAWRTRDPAERAKALEVPKPPPVPDGQGSLFDDWEAV